MHDSDGNLFDDQPAGDRLDQELRGMELLLAQFQQRQELRSDRPVAVRAVGDARAGQDANQAVEDRDPELAGEHARLAVAEDARALRELHPAFQDRSGDAVEIFG